MRGVNIYTNSTFNETVEIKRYLEPVTYHIVLGVNFFADFLSSWTDFLGGKSESYQSRLKTINKEVIEGIQREVARVGGNAGIDLKIDNDEISAQGKSMIMVTAIATAVLINKIEETSENLEEFQPGEGFDVVTLSQFSRFKEKIEFKNAIVESSKIGPLNRIIPEIKSHHYDLLPVIIEAINQGDFSPNDFTKESFEVIKNMILNLDYSDRSKLLYESLGYYLDESNSLSYRLVKLRFYRGLIENTNSIDYSQINRLLKNDNQFVQDYLIPHFKDSVDQKFQFIKEDISLLENSIIRLQELNADDSCIEKIRATKGYLELLFGGY